MDTTPHDQRYDAAFQAAYEHLCWRRANDAGFTPARLKQDLEAQYLYEGMDWEGRGELANLRIAATIAAHERLLAEWEAEEDAGDAAE